MRKQKWKTHWIDLDRFDSNGIISYHKFCHIHSWEKTWGKNTQISIVRIQLWEPNSRVISCVRRALIFPQIYSMGILLYLLFFFPLARYEERTKNALIRRSHYGSGGTLSTNLSTQCRQTAFFTIPSF